MKKSFLLLTILSIFVMSLNSCVRANPKCKKAHKNIKKLHLQNW